MKTLTIGALLADGPQDHGGATLYVFRDGAGAPLYVGKSTHCAHELAAALVQGGAEDERTGTA